MRDARGSLRGDSEIGQSVVANVKAKKQTVLMDPSDPT